MEKPREEMNTYERQEAMFIRWLSPEGIEFASPEVKKAYRTRVTRIKDAIQMKKEPDRVPVIPTTGFFPALYDGISVQEAMYDYDKCYRAFKKYTLDMQPDAHLGLFNACPGKAFEVLDYKLYVWPGHGVAEHTYQCVEGEYMMADEYDALIRDPSNFFRSVYLPRIFGKLEPFSHLPPFTGILMMPFTGPYLMGYGIPDIQKAYKALMEAGQEALKWTMNMAAFDKEMAQFGTGSRISTSGNGATHDDDEKTHDDDEGRHDDDE